MTRTYVKATLVLQIAGTDESDYGTYTCTAENGIGSAVRAQIDVMQICESCTCVTLDKKLHV